MSSLYVRTPGAFVHRRGQRLLVEHQGRTLATARLRELTHLVLIGSVQLSSSALAACLEAPVETVFLSMSGRYRGRLAPAEGKNVFLRQTQFRRLDDPSFRLATARAIVAGKLRSMRGLLKRQELNHPEFELKEAIAALDEAMDAARESSAMASLLGVEGQGARVYFGAFPQIVRCELTFGGRSRRPPRDEVNAALSFGYTLVGSELAGALAAVGLDPDVGLMHELHYGRPSLALDLLEEFRQPVVDRLVLSLVNRRVLRAEQFEKRSDGAVYLNAQGRDLFIRYYHRTLQHPLTSRSGAKPASFRDLFQAQAASMRALVEKGTPHQPIQVRM